MAKATKIIPVMLMGKLISKSTYEYYEYFTAVLISIGMTLFMLTSDSHKTGKPKLLKWQLKNYFFFQI